MPRGFDEEDRIVYDGGAGDDVFTVASPESGFVRDGFSHETYIGGDGNDFIDARGFADQTIVAPGEGADTIFADARNSIQDDNSSDAYARFEILDFDSTEDVLVVDVGVEPTVDGSLPTDPIELDVELVEVVTDEGISTEVRISLPDTTEVDLAN